MTDKALRRIGILGDIHAEDVFLATALEFFATAGVDRIVSLVTG